MRILRESPALARKAEAAGIPEKFAFWEGYRRRYLFFSAGEQILSAEEPVEGFYFLLSGRMRIYNLTPDGKLVTLSLCRPEDPGLLGDTEYLSGEKAPSHVEAVEDAVLLEVRFDRERMEEDIALYRFLARMQLYKMQQVSRDAIRQAMFTLPQRFAGYLLAASDGGRFTGSYGDAAGYLGCSYRQLMRVTAALYKEGVLRREGNVTRILDLPRLKEMAEGK